MFSAVVRFWPDSARTKIPSAKTAATQKINRAALDIFILLVLFYAPALRGFYVESQPALYGSMSGILRRHPRRRQAESLNGRQDRGVSSVRNGNRTVTERTALNISPLSPVSSRRYSVTVMG
jgi:hypothetical protein